MGLWSGVSNAPLSQTSQSRHTRVGWRTLASGKFNSFFDLNNNEYLEHLTRTGPKRLHILTPRQPRYRLPRGDVWKSTQTACQYTLHLSHTSCSWSSIYIVIISSSTVTSEVSPELCESRGGRPGLPVLMSFTVSVVVKQHWTMLRLWSQFVPNNYANRHPRTWSSTSSSVHVNNDSRWQVKCKSDTYRYALNGVRLWLSLACDSLIMGLSRPSEYACQYSSEARRRKVY